jgi:hypothetical protein
MELVDRIVHLIVLIIVSRWRFPIARRFRPDDRCRPYHVPDSGGKSEKKECRQPPRRRTEQTIDAPPERCSDEDPGDEIRRHSHRQGEAGLRPLTID